MRRASRLGIFLPGQLTKVKVVKHETVLCRICLTKSDDVILHNKTAELETHMRFTAEERVTMNERASPRAQNLGRDVRV